MNTFSVTILGSSAAIAARNRGLTAQVLRYGRELFLIDCGEGTQFQLRRYKIPMGHINHIFISHLHGDHFFGLIGLLSTWHLLRRIQPLQIYAPAPLEHILKIQLEASGTELNYPLTFHRVSAEASQLILNHPQLEVSTLPLIHRVPTTGFLFREKEQPRRINPETIHQYGVPFQFIESLRWGDDFTDPSGKVIPNAELTFPAPESRSYAYCSDTAYNESLIPLIADSTVLYHEATFMHDRVASAAEKGHSTSIQAATIAAKAKVRRLLLGHFSARYEELLPLLEEAQNVFKDSVIVEDGTTYDIQ
ncbi:MAG: ribonuclease Z [Lentimicrobium sp.]|jgi:ribonuclease Z|nr:ribonuclease Z [Lentimicrobium sp.]